MNKRDFEGLLKGIREMHAIRRGELKPARERVYTASELKALRARHKPVNIRAARQKLRLTQPEFARMIGVPNATLQNWEQGRTKPQGPALALLRVTARNPRAVAEALHA